MAKATRDSLRLRLLTSLLLLAVGFGAAVSAKARAEAYEDGRTASGARLFRAMVAADLDIEGKAGADGVLTILVVHDGDEDAARNLGELVARVDARRNPEPIKGLRVRIQVAPIDTVSLTGLGKVAAIFVAEPLPQSSLARLISFAAGRHIILYSPFEGDVERGVSGGLSIEAQVRPYVNASSLKGARVRLKEFFLKVAKVHP